MSHATPPSLPATPRPERARRHRQLPPGPSWHTAAWNTVKFARQRLRFLQELRERYGDLVTLPTVLGPWTLVFHPDGVRHVVQENHFNYRKGGISHQVLRLMLGNGLLPNNGESWLRQLRLIQPVFHRQRIAAFGRLMTESALAWTEETNIDTQQPLDLFQEMSGLTLSIVCQALFGQVMPVHKEPVFQATSTINHLEAQAFYVPGLLSLPTPQRHRLFEARNTLYTVVDELIAKRRQASTENDLLTMLLQARDEETGEGMTDEQVRDEVVTLMAAGQETTSNALCWTLVLLAQHPDIEARLQQEYQQVLGGRAPQIEDLPQLILATSLPRYQFRLLPGASVVPEPLITLRPRGKLLMTIHRQGG